VGWGDSILIESEDNYGKRFFALVDSNDTENLCSSFIFIKKHFERTTISLPGDKPVFEFVLLTHAHSDHGQGLKKLMREYGTKNFWYPKSLSWSSLADLIRFANSSSNVRHHQSIDNTKVGITLGDVAIDVLWPPYDEQQIDRNNENNNSVVLALKLNTVTFVLSGDAEKEVWNQISSQIPANTRFFKVPHHGSINGTFDGVRTPWFDGCPSIAYLGISSHVVPFSHPDQEVIDLFDQNNRIYFRTDIHYHLSFQTDGNTVSAKYSHI
jgi:beta-lactamase superfamily II metal-dependent hydrolase